MLGSAWLSSKMETSSGCLVAEATWSGVRLLSSVAFTLAPASNLSGGGWWR